MKRVIAITGVLGMMTGITGCDKAENVYNTVLEAKDKIFKEKTEVKLEDAEVKKTKSEYSKEKNTANIEETVGNYLNGFVKAINGNNYSYLEDYVIQDSPLYKEVKPYIQNKIEEKLLSYEITKEEYPDADTCKITVIESYEVQNYKDPIHDLSLWTQYELKKQSDGSWKFYAFNDKTKLLSKTAKYDSKKPYDFSDENMFITDLDKFIEQYGQPISETTESWMETGFNAKKLKYEFGEVTFVSHLDKEEEYFLQRISSTKDLIGTPRGIKIGDSVESVISKFPNDKNYKTGTEDNTKMLYEVYIGCHGLLKYDSKGQIDEIRYIMGQGGGFNSLSLKIKDNRVYSINTFKGLN